MGKGRRAKWGKELRWLSKRGIVLAIVEEDELEGELVGLVGALDVVGGYNGEEGAEVVYAFLYGS